MQSFYLDAATPNVPRSTAVTSSHITIEIDQSEGEAFNFCQTGNEEYYFFTEWNFEKIFRIKYLKLFWNRKHVNYGFTRQFCVHFCVQ